MRLWSLHPQYLDPQGLVAHWRETLLAQAVLRGQTRGYRNHPQLDRFKQAASPLDAISLYLQGIYAEAKTRGYTFDAAKIHPAQQSASLSVTTGQVAYEWQHLLSKLKNRDPKRYEQWRHTPAPNLHPLFTVREGEIEPWERYAPPQ